MTSEKPSSTCFLYTSSQRVLAGQNRLRVPEASRGASASRVGRRGDLHLQPQCENHAPFLEPGSLHLNGQVP